jgi:hypothetical protein
MTTNKIASKFTLLNYIKNHYPLFQKTVHNLPIKKQNKLRSTKYFTYFFFCHQNTKRHSNFLHGKKIPRSKLKNNKNFSLIKK